MLSLLFTLAGYNYYWSFVSGRLAGLAAAEAAATGAWPVISDAD